MYALFQSYPPTINFLECWMHLSDGSAKVVTLSHHAMRASNASEKLLYLQMSLRISPIPCLLFPACFLPTPEEFSFDSCYQFVLQCSEQSWVLQDAHSGNSITFVVDSNLRFRVSRQHQSLNNSTSTPVFSSLEKWTLELFLEFSAAFQSY